MNFREVNKKLNEFYVELDNLGLELFLAHPREYKDLKARRKHVYEKLNSFRNTKISAINFFY